MTLAGVVSDGAADEQAAPKTLQIPAEVKPIQAASSGPTQRVASAEGPVTARWAGTQTHGIGERKGWRSQAPRDKTNSPAKVATERLYTATRISDSERDAAANLRSFVRPASQLTPVDPFDNPFGDKPTSDEGPSILTGQPAPSEAQAAETQAAELEASSKPATEADGEPVAAPPRAPSPRPAAPYAEFGGDAASNREFNGRYCGDETDNCEVYRDFVRSLPITDISPDITPRNTLALLDGGPDLEYEEELEMELAKSPERAFHSRQGEVLAEGRLSNFVNGRVWITGPDGQVVKVPLSDLSDSDLCFVSAWWSLPTECAVGDEPFQGRAWDGTTFTWKASGVCHKPLYFEEPQLERYGHSLGPIKQPLVSGAHFFLNVAALPYKMGIHPPHECQYPLGYYRPGSCAPWLVPPIPLSIRGGLLAAGFYTGAAFFIP